MVALADWCVECEKCAHNACLTTAMFTIDESASSDLFADISLSLYDYCWWVLAACSAAAAATATEVALVGRCCRARGARLGLHQVSSTPYLKVFHVHARTRAGGLQTHNGIELTFARAHSFENTARQTRYHITI